MQFYTISALFALMTAVSALPSEAVKAQALKIPQGIQHNECEYSGVTGGAWAQGTCRPGGQYGEGICNIAGYAPASCDYPYHNDAQVSPCGNAADSQYSCKYPGAPCWAFKFAEDQSLTVLHCGVA